MTQRSVSVNQCSSQSYLRYHRHRNRSTFYLSYCAKVREPMFIFCLLITCVIHVNAYEKNGIRNIKDYILDTELHRIPVERRIFNLTKNGFKIDVKVVSLTRNNSVQNKNDSFPKFPVKDIGKCIIEFSLGCIKKRFVRFLETVSRLDEITLFGQDVKLVKSRTVRRSEARSMNDSDVSIERSVDDFFDSYTLRITLPRWNSKREKNQIDVMFDETAVAEGRGKKGGGGGCGGGKGGKCKMMMMGMMMMLKMKLIGNTIYPFRIFLYLRTYFYYLNIYLLHKVLKLHQIMIKYNQIFLLNTIGLAAFKSMMMGGMSLMLSMMMFMKGKGGGGGGPWKGGGGGGGDQYKEIVLVTKSSGGGGGGGGCCGGGGGPSDSYGAPPPSSYGPPSGGGGGYGGGGGGWGRSFHKRPMIYDKETKTEIADGSNYIPMTGEVMSNAESTDYLDYQDYQEPSSIKNSSSVISNWNAPSYTDFHQYTSPSVSTDLAKNNLKSEATGNAKAAKGRSFIFDENPINPINIVNVMEKNVDSMTTTNQPVADVTHEFTTNTVYMDEWQATAEKTSANNVLSTNSTAEIELQTKLRSRDIPLLHKI
ncbi:Uncharacterized protein DBV15_07031 [Temnothorax longispinosus]|uniref:Uncharacterized protein n=1 Tax=Temnothorax longispinosus TaxID=300112 RepID=A0A4S2JH27_9HYME|nr:Uncharacterized protein DBV15_07031 [Temnothorax longispinosus]